MTIFKYPFELTGLVHINMPEGAKPICVDCQRGQPSMWAIVDPDAPKVMQQFYVIGTGNPFPERVGNHIGSFQMYDGGLVWHVFERAKS